MNMAQRLLGHAPSSQEETRWRLLQSATEVFAELGFKAATTREIARRAEVNLASIHYHFGDKAALYREVFRLPFLNDCNSFAIIDVASIATRDALYAMYVWLFPPEAESDPMLQQFMRLHAREEGDPSGVLGDAMVQAFRPNHENLLALLCRELQVSEADDEVQRLAFSLVGLATVYLHGARNAVEAFAPQLLQGVPARETMVERLVDQALVLIAGEKKRRTKLQKEST
ncbi:MAG: TetR/AcrR family transcriptional regulator [Gammaproteobacteria bacterium]|nr:TetR/AcrR family transcriptional regulator [Gammaproteobacteria bacterium]MBU1624491.1 TetR/AcrR family transcriptional regulator [Gammaproteobacteria bacterium]MBU1982335.1 TetR/AcrR family transcriptional regulator [Gammaproteobacteria bacterium]